MSLLENEWECEEEIGTIDVLTTILRLCFGFKRRVSNFSYMNTRFIVYQDVLVILKTHSQKGTVEFGTLLLLLFFDLAFSIEVEFVAFRTWKFI